MFGIVFQNPKTTFVCVNYFELCFNDKTGKSYLLIIYSLFTYKMERLKVKICPDQSGIGSNMDHFSSLCEVISGHYLPEFTLQVTLSCN